MPLRSGSHGPRVNTANGDVLIAEPYLRRVARLARKLIGAHFEGSDDLWQLQVDLLGLQREIQQAIRSAKASSRRTVGRYEELRILKIARWQARQLGDAYAWVLLDLDRKIIYPLGFNDRVPISKENHGSRGLIAIASHLSGEGWGFPMLHDVTDCLRIGDVSFVKRDDGLIGGCPEFRGTSVAAR